MSLYYDAATVLTANAQEGSLKSIIYGNRFSLRSKPAHLYALISETAKYDRFLTEVIDNAGFLSQEPKLTPILSILVVHDHLFSKGGIAASSSHPLRRAIERHKARLQAEFSKARLKRKCTTVEDLKRHLLGENPPLHRSEPRWVRVNTLKASLEQELGTTFDGYKTDATISEVAESLGTAKVLAIDKHIPDVLALPPEADVTKTQAYKEGRILLQDKASCFPAYLLVGDQTDVRDCIDGCAAPGNKTSHLASLLSGSNASRNKIYACERDHTRSKMLQSRMQRAAADNVTVLAGCDFLGVNPKDAQYQNVTHLLLDPSCSGSGIIGREDIPSLALPLDRRAERLQNSQVGRNLKKRKRDHGEVGTVATAEEAAQLEEVKDALVDKARLQKLSSLQSRIVEHAFSFPAAVRVTYSTCSVHVEENEAVVSRVLASGIAKSRGWRVLRRQDQVAGLRRWESRGVQNSSQTDGGTVMNPPPLMLSEEQREACIRCHPGDDEGTMGFFVCGFVRSTENIEHARDHPLDSDDSWEGFSD